MIIFGSICSGIEAASVAWRPLGFTPAFFSEIEDFPRNVLATRQGAADARFRRPAGSVPLWGDFTTLRVRHMRRMGIPLPHVLVGGTPCQSFSVAGRRLSLSDDRGNLSLAYVRLAHALAATGSLRNAVWENVPGVLSVEDNAFGCFVGALVGSDDALPCPGGGTWPDAGMVAGPRSRAAWRVLDTQHFGLPQRRRRIFLVVDFGGGADPAAVLFEPKSQRGDHPPGVEASQDLAGTLAGGARENGGYSADDIPLIAGTLSANGKAAGSATQQDADGGMLIVQTLRANGGSGGAHRSATANGYGFRRPSPDANRMRADSRLSRQLHPDRWRQAPAGRG